MVVHELSHTLIDVYVGDAIFASDFDRLKAMPANFERLTRLAAAIQFVDDSIELVQSDWNWDEIGGNYICGGGCGFIAPHCRSLLSSNDCILEIGLKRVSTDLQSTAI